MSASMHSPGPWWFDAEELLVRAHDGNIVVDVDSGDDSEPECSANGRLIASAPELADALEAIVDLIGPARASGLLGDGAGVLLTKARLALRAAGRATP